MLNSRRLFIVVLLTLLFTTIAAGSSLANSATVTTDKADYNADETAIISGTGFAANLSLDVRVTAPDGSVLSGAGDGSPGPDSVLTDSNGSFSLNYALFGTYPDGSSYYGQEGTYVVDVLDAGGAVLASTTFTDSHFRFGHVTWRRTGSTTVRFNVRTGWRGTACSDVFFTSVVLRFGDGQTTRVAGPVVATGTDSAGNTWCIKQDEVTHTYGGYGPYTAYFSNCCRIFGLANASSASYRVETVVDLRNGNAGSPVSSLPAILQMSAGGPQAVPIPFADPNGNPVTCRLASWSESAIPSQPSAGGHPLQVSSNCVLTWDTTNASVGQLYAAQVILEEHLPGGIISDIALDFIIEIVGGSPPVCALNGDAHNVVPAGQTFSISATGSDSDGGTLAVSHLGLPAGATLNPASGTSGPEPLTATFSWTPDASDAGSAHAVTLVYTDPTNLQSLCSFSIEVPANQPPVADAGGPYSGDEGAAISLSGAASSDADGDPLTYNWTVDSNTCAFDDPSSASPHLTCGDNGSFTATLDVSDGQATTTDTTAVTVANVAPAIDSLTGPAEPANISDQSSVGVAVAFSDPGTLDTHDVTWNWGDGSSDLQAGVTSPAAQNHNYSTAGVYAVTVTVTDDDGGTVSQAYEYIVIYDPNGGFVTGGGWIDSPAGAYVADVALSGRANFGFVSKYKKGATTPSGQTEFQFTAGDLNFHSSSYEWLVVAGSNKAKYKGVGTINGAGNYGFMLTVIDNGNSNDTFRIKIWDKDNGDALVYDNQMGADDDAYDGTAIGGGNIKVHNK